MQAFLDSIQIDFNSYLREKQDIAFRQQYLDQDFKELRGRATVSITRKRSNVTVSAPTKPFSAQRSIMSPRTPKGNTVSGPVKSVRFRYGREINLSPRVASDRAIRPEIVPPAAAPPRVAIPYSPRRTYRRDMSTYQRSPRAIHRGMTPSPVHRFYHAPEEIVIDGNEVVHVE